MRDWNSELGEPELPTAFEFVAYLWGIETSKSNMIIIAGSSFVAYLWGIETFDNIS